MYLPATQPTHSPSVHDQPAVQKQSESSLLPGWECEPARHSTQCELSCDVYEPAAQCVQLFTGEATAAEKNPASHCTQSSADCGCTLYFPAGQALQLPAAVYPALHLHAAALSLPSGESECALHGTHVERSCEEYDAAEQVAHAFAGVPSVGRCVPASHMVQVALPDAALNLPATHAVHGWP